MSSRQLDRPLDSGPRQMGIGIMIQDGSTLKDIMQRRADAGRTELFQTLFILNILILIGGALFSYMLARKTLRPIEEAMDAQTQFVSDASHELRTPLTALQTTNEVALRKKQISSSETKTLLKNNVEEIVKLHGLTNALLQIVRHDQIVFTKEIVSLQDVVSEAMSSVITLAQSKDITVEDKVPLLSVNIHKNSLIQVLQILIDNAIKYSPNKSTVSLSAEQVGNHVIIYVIDKGIGIAESDQEKIFTRFYRVDQSRSKTKSEGYGLGLAIAKTICDHYGMKLTVTSKESKGSTFSVQIKANVEHQ